LIIYRLLLSCWFIIWYIIYI